jgi:hypothetical protein
MWNTTSDIVDSIIFQKTSEIGINTTTPAAKLDVNGKTDIRDTLTLFPKGTDSTLAIHGTAFQIDNTGAVTTPVLNATDANVSDVLSINSAAEVPLSVTASPSSTTAILGTTGSNEGIGVAGVATTTSGIPWGVYGATSSPNGIGVLGHLGALLSGTFNALQAIGGASGVWGDGGGIESQAGVIGTNDDSFAGYFASSASPSGLSAGFSMWVQNTSSGTPFVAGSGPSLGALKTYCEIDNTGNLNCTGNKNAIVPIDGGKRTVAMSAIESPQNWFEDAGAAQLVKGSAVITLDPDFIQTVNTDLDYKVFPVPNGDCKGLYVTNKTSTSFEVRELGGGTSSIAFDYRIMALRKKYENVRFADHTNDPDPRKMADRMKSARQQARPSLGAKSESKTRENQLQER